MRFAILLATAGLSVLVFAVVLGLGAGGSVRAATTDIQVDNFYFCEAADEGQVCEKTVTTGDTVRWNLEDGTHTVTQCDATFASCPPAGGFDSGNLTKDSPFSQTFTSPGSIAYRCTFHPTQMMGRITVVAAQATATPAASAAAAPASTAVRLPISGGPPSDGSSGVPWAILLAVLGAGFVAGSAVVGLRAIRAR